MSRCGTPTFSWPSSLLSPADSDQIQVEWWAIPPTGSPFVLAEVTDFDIADIFGARGAISVSTPVGTALHNTLLTHTLLADRDLEVEIRLFGGSAQSLRGFLLASEADEVAEDGLRKFSGTLVAQRMYEAVLFPDPTDEKGETKFKQATAGAIVQTLMDRARKRGAVTDITTATFSTTKDSLGNTWPLNTTITFSPGASYGELLEELTELGLCEWEVTGLRELKLYAPGERGFDHTVSNPIVVLHRGRDLTEAPRSHSVRDSVTDMLVAGKEGLYETVYDGSALARRGRRIESYESNGQLESSAALRGYGQNKLATLTSGTMELTHGLVVNGDGPQPFLNINVGDLLWSDTGSIGGTQKLRVQQVTLSRSGDEYTAIAVVGTLCESAIVTLNRKLARLQRGSAVVGTTTADPGTAGEDTTPPSTPVGLVGDSIAYQDVADGETLALVTVGWEAVTTSAGGPSTSLAKAAKLILDRIRSGEHIYEDWTWVGAPALVTQYNDPLLALYDGESGGGEPSPQVEAARQILARLRSGQTIFEDWTWHGASHVVGQYNDALLDLFGDEYDSHYDDDPAQFFADAEEFLDNYVSDNASSGQSSADGEGWLATYVSDNSMAATVTDDVSGYLVRYAYLGWSQVGGVATGDPFGGENLVYFLATDNTGTTDTSFTWGGVSAGADILVEVMAFDRAGNESEWSAPLTFTTAVDNLPPPVTSRPTVSEWLGTIKVTWDGLGSVGEAMSPDFSHVEVHVSPALDFTPDATTYQTNMSAAGTWNVVDRSYGVALFARLVAVDRAGNAAAPSQSSEPAIPRQLVDQDLINGILTAEKIADFAVNSAKIVNGAIINAKIADLAVNDAKIMNLSVGKITTGTLIADVTLSGIIRTSLTGARAEIDAAGVRLYDSVGTNTVRLSAIDGSALITGTYRSGLSGERINIENDGTFRLYGPAGTDYAQIANVAGVVQARSRADGSGRRSYVTFSPSELRVSYGSETGTPRSMATFGLTYGIVTAPATGMRVTKQFSPDDGTQNRFFMVVSSNNSPSGDYEDSVLHYFRRSNGSPAIQAPVQDCGLVWAPGTLAASRGDTTASGTITSSGFITISSLEVKTRPAVARFGRYSASDVLLAAPAKQWEYLFEADRPERPDLTVTRVGDDGVERQVPAEWSHPQQSQRTHYGPIAEELAAVDPSLAFRDYSGLYVTDLRDLVGVNWAATAETVQAVRDLQEQLARIERRLGPGVVDGSIDDRGDDRG